MERTLDFFHADPDIFGRRVVMGIDPGVTTGVSVFVVDDKNQVMAWGDDQISYGGSGNVEDVLKDETFPEQEISRQIACGIIDWAKENEVILVIEDFVIRQKNSAREFLAPVRLTAGIVQELYGKQNIKITYQSPSDAKGTCTDERMDLWGYPIRTQKDRHSRDASRHAILLLRRLIGNPSHEKNLLSLSQR